MPYLFHFRDTHLVTTKDGIDLRAGKISLKDFSLIYCRGFWNYQPELALISQFCIHNKIPLFDSALLKKRTISKMDDMFVFAANNLPVPKTIFQSVTYNKDEILRELDFPIVAKENRSRKGIDVYLLKNERQLENFLKKIKPKSKTLDMKLYQFQEFIPADFDMRLIVVGNRVIGSIKRQNPNPHDFRHNISLGAIAEKISVTPEMKRLAVKAAKVLKYEFAGIDLITNKNTGKTYLIEANRSPFFEGFMKATSIDVAYEVMDFFLRKCKFLLRFSNKKIK